MVTNLKEKQQFFCSSTNSRVANFDSSKLT